MAVVVYKCNVCKREIELQRNEKGLETTNHCIITHGCRGELYQVDLLVDFVRGSFPLDVAGLDNWQQRKVLYNHTQTIERMEWNIVHNLGTFPSIQIFVNRPVEGDEDRIEEIFADDTIIVDKNTLKLVFERAWSGKAQLIARSSDPQLLQQRDFSTPTPEASTEISQISNSAEITIATRIVDPFVDNAESDPTNIVLELTYITPDGNSIPIEYTVDNTPNINNSPWRDFNRVIIKGKVYSVRSFNILVPEITNPDPTVVNNSNFRITSIDRAPLLAGSPSVDTRPLVANEMFILLSTTPHANVDKITDRIIDATSVTATSNPFALFYNLGEVYVDISIAQTIFPPVRETSE